MLHKQSARCDFGTQVVSKMLAAVQSPCVPLPAALRPPEVTPSACAPPFGGSFSAETAPDWGLTFLLVNGSDSIQKPRDLCSAPGRCRPISVERHRLRGPGRGSGHWRSRSISRRVPV